MKLDHLLLWLSAKGAGSWPQFRSAVEELQVQEASVPPDSDDEGGQSTANSDLPVYQKIRFAMQRLGHVEFRTKEAKREWRVVPPVVAFLVGAPEQGLLCGARSPELLDDVRHLSDLDVLFSNVEGGPSRVLLRGPSEDAVATRARDLGFHVQKAASLAILSSVPRARDPRAWHRIPMPATPGWSVHDFSVSRLQWVDGSQVNAANAHSGLFRFVMKHQRFYFLRWRGVSYRVPVQVGKYVMMRRNRGILKYDADRRTLTVPVVCRPPLLIERALILCSGLLPRFDSGTGYLEYVDIPQEAVHIAAQLLGQEVG